MARKYTDHQWSRAYEAFQSARSAGGEGKAEFGESVTKGRSGKGGGRRGRERPERSKNKSTGLDSGARQMVGTLFVAGLIAGFLFAVVHGWSMAYLGGSVAIVGFFGATALFASIACLFALVRLGALAALDILESRK